MDIEKNEFDNEELDNIIHLNDEDGNDVPFEFLDLIEYESNEYVVLLPADDEDADEVVILKVEESQNEDEESYVGVEDQGVLDLEIPDEYQRRLNTERVAKIAAEPC